MFSRYKAELNKAALSGRPRGKAGLTSLKIVPNIRAMLGKVLLNSFAALIRSIKIIFHQLVGLFFLLLGLSALIASWREYQKYTPEVFSTVVRFFTTVGFAVFLLLFAAISFFRARGERKKQ